MTSVRIEHVSKSFGDAVALSNVDLHIAAGELFFLLGPSGCGKTTLLRIIAGLQEPTSGRIFFNDADVTDMPTSQRSAVMCFQSYALWPHMTVRQNIRFGLEMQGVDRHEQNRRVDEAIALVQLQSMAERRPNQLSGGQQQRVALARALVVRPRCLLLDEPLSNLDAKLRLEMRGEIRRICRQAGLTAIYVTHDQKESLSIADRMAVLNAGRIEQIGKPQEVYLRPQNRFVANFMGETNFLDATVSSVEAGRVTVASPIGLLQSTVPTTARLSCGDRATVSLRPEAIRIGDAPAGAANVFNAAVHHTIYLGEVAQHQVDVAGPAGQSVLKVFELNPRVVAMDESRHETRIHIDPEDVVILTS